MDLRQPLRFVLAAVAFVLCGAATASAPTLLLREQAWTAPGETLAYDLTHAPGECTAAPLEPSAQIGRALFRSPGLLGGPAARAGLSCNACHSNGRINTRFMLPELTDRVAAADVTSEWASHVRGDGVMNPRDIPDLAGAGQRSSFGHAADPSLEHFVHSVITEEFQGHEPPSAALQGVIAYLRALRTEACPAAAVPITLAGAAADVHAAIDAARTAPDAETARLVLLAGQDGIGRIVERLPARRFAADRARFEALAREIAAWRDENVLAAMEAGAPGWNARFDAAVARVARRERQTYFNEATLRRALAR